MHIALFSPGIDPCPATDGNGSIETVLTNEAIGLAELGHTVYVFASDDSTIGNLHQNIVHVPYGTESLRKRGLEGGRGDVMRRQYIMPRALETLATLKVDVLHIHDLEAIHAVTHATADISRRLPPSIITAHWSPFDERVPQYKLWESRPIAAISQDQADHKPDWADYVVYNGIDTSFFRPADRGAPMPTWLRETLASADPRFQKAVAQKGFLQWVARFAPEKDPLMAMHVAIRLNMPIILAGKTDSYHREYAIKAKQFAKAHPALVLDLGEQSREQVRDLCQLAKVLVNPIAWDEPFGLNVAEAMSCGLPVATIDRGAMSELIAQGTSGIMVAPPKDLEQLTDHERSKELQQLATRLADAVTQCLRFDTNACRTNGERFGINAMVAGYEHVFHDLIQKSKARRAA